MRVCHICSGHLAEDPRVYHREGLALAAAGYEVHIFGRMERHQPVETAANPILHGLIARKGRAQRVARRWRIARSAMDVKPDILHVHEPELLGPVLGLAGKRPVIWDVHESYLDVLADRAWIPNLSRRALGYAWDRYERTLVTRCAAVVAATPRVAGRYRALHGRVVTVANYPPVTNVTGQRDREPLTCCFTGVMSENRGVRTAIQALSLLKGRGLEVRLELAGRVSPEYLSQLHQVAAGLGVTHLVNYRGVLDRNEVLALQSTCAVGLVPHLAHGNNLAAWPVKMFEFMANATPMVFSDLPSHQEIAGLAGAGLSVKAGDPRELADAVERLLTSPALARQMGEAGRRAIDEHFNWQVEARKLTQLYEELVAQAYPSF